MATGDAPIMKQKNYKVDQEKKVEWIIAFIRKYLKLEDAESLVRFFLLKVETTYDSKVCRLQPILNKHNYTFSSKKAFHPV